MNLVPAVDNAANPCGKGGNRRKVKDKLADGNFIFQHHGDQQRIRAPVTNQDDDKVCGTGTGFADSFLFPPHNILGG